MVIQKPKKLNFREAVETCVVFYNDEVFEQKFDNFIQDRINEIIRYEILGFKEPLTPENLAAFLRTQPQGLLRILGQLRLSQEKFKRIVTLIRKLDGTFDREWNIEQIKKRLNADNEFALRLSNAGGNNPQTLAFKVFY